MIAVPGAELYTEKAGDGPALLLISGGGGDAGMYERIVPLLARTYTVLSYDRRGNSRSRLAEPATDIGPAQQAADAVAVLDHYGIDRAYVFGSSGGGIITMELVTHHGRRLLGAVAHEPPLIQVLAADSPERREFERLHQLADQRSPLRAYAAFGAMILDDPPWVFRSPAGQTAVAGGSRALLAIGGLARRVTGREPDAMTRQLGNADLLMLREMPTFLFEYQPDLAALAASPVPWRLATGRDSVGRPYHRPAHVLAQRLGVPVVEFPGGHTLYVERPEEFVATLLPILAELQR